MREIFTFPNPVDEVSARTVAAGVVILSIITVITASPWLMVLLALGFLARVASGPTLSPLGQLATRVIRPVLPVAARPVPGPPKRFAQGIGATLSVAAVIAEVGFDTTGVAVGLVAAIAVAAALEAVVGFCLGCRIFALLMSGGIIPETVCEACSDLSLRQPARS